VQGSAGYNEIAQRLLREALTQLGALSVRVRADEKTQKIFTSSLLEKISAEMKVQLQPGELLRKGTGVIVETDDGRRQYDNTLETRLKRLQDTLRGPVYRILMGESV
jgi:vacuolar-type H+-ATPase subunit E/Vma4